VSDTMEATTTDKKPRTRRGGRPPIDSPERLISQPVRLRMLMALSSSDSLPFTRLQEIVATNYGNLSLHARRLEGFGYIVIDKMFVDRVPRTEYRLTDEGRRALRAYLNDHALSVDMGVGSGQN
jgi:DNA-binding MarR family transcriptional regulator